MPKMSFFPNIGFQPVKDHVNVSVIMNDGTFEEGPANQWYWEMHSKRHIDQWRKMQPSEVLHDEHRPKHPVEQIGEVACG